MSKSILKELKHHAPFTVLGALTGILLLFICRKLPSNYSYNLFYTFHPLHVFLSAFITASMYKLHKKGKNNLLFMVFISYVGSIGIATISDCLFPYLGETFLKMPNAHFHFGFIEKWWLINPLAIGGIALAFFVPSTKFPHAAHVLLSTWASLFHILMAGGKNFGILTYFIIFFILFIAVWTPCCLSDIVFPLLFIKERSTDKKQKPLEIKNHF